MNQCHTSRLVAEGLISGCQDTKVQCVIFIKELQECRKVRGGCQQLLFQHLSKMNTKCCLVQRSALKTDTSVFISTRTLERSSCLPVTSSCLFFFYVISKTTIITLTIGKRKAALYFYSTELYCRCVEYRYEANQMQTKNAALFYFYFSHL